VKRITHTSKSGDRLLHIETDFGIVNVRVGLHDADGNAVTSVEIIPDRVDWDEKGRTIVLDGYANNRLIAKTDPGVARVGCRGLGLPPDQRPHPPQSSCDW
jgi:hypothetical protein